MASVLALMIFLSRLLICIREMGHPHEMVGAVRKIRYHNSIPARQVNRSSWHLETISLFFFRKVASVGNNLTVISKMNENPCKKQHQPSDHPQFSAMNNNNIESFGVRNTINNHNRLETESAMLLEVK